MLAALVSTCDSPFSPSSDPNLLLQLWISLLRLSPFLLAHLHHLPIVYSVFEFDVNVITYDKVMTHMSKLWRDVKSTIYNSYLFGKRKGKDPCKDYPFVTPEMWETFLKQHSEESTKILREENKEKADSNNYTNTLFRGGVDGLEKKMMQERLRSFKRELESQGNNIHYYGSKPSSFSC